MRPFGLVAVRIVISDEVVKAMELEDGGVHHHSRVFKRRGKHPLCEDQGFVVAVEAFIKASCLGRDSVISRNRSSRRLTGDWKARKRATRQNRHLDG